MSLATLYLNKGAERRLRGGHLWVYSNEVDVKRSALKAFEAGQQVNVCDAADNCLGVAMMNPQHLICARLVSRVRDQQLDRNLLAERMVKARARREAVYFDECYRMVYGDSDLLPGLVIDRYRDVYSVQCNSAGMAALEAEIIDILQSEFAAQGVVLRNDSLARASEQLELAVTTIGDVPEWVALKENGVEFVAPLATGQKTGWFYDHRDNRAQLQRWAKDKAVLDVFSYAGGWGVAALAAGASSLTCVDSSELALEAVNRNAKAFGKPVSCFQGEAAEMLKRLAQSGQTFDIVVVDPPAFIKRRKDHASGLKAYHQLNQLALKLLAPNGLLVSASCSMSLTMEDLHGVVASAARNGKRDLQIVYTGTQAADHPVHPHIPETSYLKAIFAQALG